jgi:hypothetical protein
VRLGQEPHQEVKQEPSVKEVKGGIGKRLPAEAEAEDYMAEAEVVMMDVAQGQMAQEEVGQVLHLFLPVVHVLREEMPTMGMLLLQFQQ